jgi:hypothetical protein
VIPAGSMLIRFCPRRLIGMRRRSLALPRAPVNRH